VIQTRLDRITADRPLRTELGRLGTAVGIVLVVATLGALAVFPFLTGAASGRSIGFLPTPRSNLGGLLLVYGAFLGISAAYLASRAERRNGWGIALLVAVLLVATTAIRAPAVALFGPPLLGAWYLLRTREDLGFETVLLVGALGLLLLVEFVYVLEEAGPGRMNTLFKISAQVWALWAVAGGTMAAWLVGPSGPGRAIADANERVRKWLLRDRVSDSNPTTGTESAGPTSTRQQIGTVVLVILLLSLSIYPVFGTIWAVGSGQTDPTLDAHAYIETEHPEEAAAIEWIDDRQGQPTMVSAPGTEIYRWVNAPSSLTGVPTVAGWNHEVGYRGSEAYWDRVRDVEILFETEEPTSRMILLEKYDVEYVYVGPIERARYDPPDFATEPGISVAYTDAHVTIYRVE
jgi:YYY domain-containing protein